jgi:voltage-gated potassium channel
MPRPAHGRSGPKDAQTTPDLWCSHHGLPAPKIRGLGSREESDRSGRGEAVIEAALKFLHLFFLGLAYISSILGLLLAFILAGAWLFHRIERRPLGAAVYMAVITAITIGCGDMTPQRLLTRVTAILLGLVGVVFTGILVSLAVYATGHALDSVRSPARVPAAK